MSRGGGTGKYKLVGGDFPTAALGGVKTQPGDFSPDKEDDATAAVAFPLYVCKKKKKRDPMATARKRDQRQVARMEKERARKRHRQNVAKEKAAAPAVGEKMIVLKEPYTSLVMAGTKTMELRSRRIIGDYYLADSTTHTVKAKVAFGESWELSQEDYDNTRELHCVDQPTKRYKRTVGTLITSVQPLAEESSYRAKRGAIGFAKFFPAAQ